MFDLGQDWPKLRFDPAPLCLVFTYFQMMDAFGDPADPASDFHWMQLHIPKGSVMTIQDEREFFDAWNNRPPTLYKRK